MGKEGTGYSLPPQGSQYSPLLLTPENTPQHVYHSRRKEGEKGWRRGQVCSPWEKALEGWKNSLYTLASVRALSLSLFSQILLWKPQQSWRLGA